MKLQDLVTDYLSLRVVRPPTERTYRYYAKRVSEHTGVKSIEECDLQNAIKFRDKLLETSKGTTWNSARRHLIALWSHAQECGAVTKNPWRELQAARVNLKPKTILDADFDRALSFLNSYPQRFSPFVFWRAVYLTLAFTGMRRAQLVGLIWSDVDFAKNTILLRSESSKTYREYSIPLCSTVRECLVLLHIDAKALWHGAPQFEDSQVFNIELHKPQGRRERKFVDDQVSRFFTKLARLSGASLSCHRMRHRLATRLLETGATHARNVQAILGHSSLVTTLNYVSPNLKELKQALEALK